MERPQILRRRIRALLVFFMAALVVSGLTAVPLQWEMELLGEALGVPDDVNPDSLTGLQHWIATVRDGLTDTNARYPFIAYGTDWLAFAHVTIAIAFIGPLIDPVRNRWVITFGMIACILVVPTALIFGAIRGIPFYWRLIDCSFGVFGIIPLLLCRKFVRQLETSSGWGRSTRDEG